MYVQLSKVKKCQKIMIVYIWFTYELYDLPLHCIQMWPPSLSYHWTGPDDRWKYYVVNHVQVLSRVRQRPWKNDSLSCFLFFLSVILVKLDLLPSEQISITLHLYIHVANEYRISHCVEIVIRGSRCTLTRWRKIMEKNWCIYVTEIFIDIPVLYMII